MRGRKPRATEDKIARGETRPSRVNYQEPDSPPPAPEQLVPPKGLAGAGLLFWKAHAQALVTTGQLRAREMPLFLRRCKTENQIAAWEAEVLLPGVDRGERMRIQRIISELYNRAIREDAELGITPVSRSKVRTVIKPPVEKPKNERFFGQQQGGLRAIRGGRE